MPPLEILLPDDWPAVGVEVGDEEEDIACVLLNRVRN